MKPEQNLAIKRALARKGHLELIRTICAIISTILGTMLIWHVLFR